MRDREIIALVKREQNKFILKLAYTGRVVAVISLKAMIIIG